MPKIYDTYFFNPSAYNTHDGGYVPLVTPNIPEQKLKIPKLLKPDQETKKDVFYTVESKTGEAQLMPGHKTKTWGYNNDLLGPTIIYKKGQTAHVKLKNSLPELTTYHWHGLDVPGPYIDGGCHAPVYPGQTKDIKFNVTQSAATLWLHPHPCPSTAAQVWHGLASMVIVKDQTEAQLPFPRNYGIDDIPVILQDRHFHKDNQWNYDADYDPDGVQGPTPMINGTINPYFDVTTQKVRLRLLNGADRREWRLHFSDNLPFAQIASGGGILPSPIYNKKLMITCAERDEIIVDFGKYKPGDEVILYTDEAPIMKFKIHQFKPDHTSLPNKFINIPNEPVTPNTAVHKVLMSGEDECVEMNGQKFEMQEINDRQEVGTIQYWDVTNNNLMHGGMIHPYHMHGTQFRVVSRNGHAPYPNEHGLKDTIGVNPGETVRLKVKFNKPGVYMYHCHILEHEDGGMMLQMQSYTKAEPYKKYKLMSMSTLVDAIAQERHIKPSQVMLPGMQSYQAMEEGKCN